ncbi:MAG: DNA methyltransferase [Halothermotrichaceae bacterium]
MSKQKLDMSGKKWIKNSISIWSDIRKNKKERELGHPALFPVMLVERLLDCFSHKGEFVFDPFAGTGSTLIGARNRDRRSIGLELSQKYINIFKERNAATLYPNHLYNPKIINDDSRNMLNYINKNVIDLTITSPPYWNILNQKRTADRKGSKNYSSKSKDLGNILSYEDFLEEIKGVFKKVYSCTKDDGYCCIIVMDIRKKNKFYPLHIDTVLIMEDINFELDDIIIWDRRHEYNNLRPLGYPYVFRVNKTHEFILIFKKH